MRPKLCIVDASGTARARRVPTLVGSRHENVNVVRGEITLVISNPCGSRLLDGHDVLGLVRCMQAVAARAERVPSLVEKRELRRR